MKGGDAYCICKTKNKEGCRIAGLGVLQRPKIQNNRKVGLHNEL